MSLLPRVRFFRGELKMLFKVDKTTLFLRNKKWEFVKKECLKYKSDTVHCFYFMTHCCYFAVSCLSAMVEFKFKFEETWNWFKSVSDSTLLLLDEILRVFFFFWTRCNINWGSTNWPFTALRGVRDTFPCTRGHLVFLTSRANGSPKELHGS